MSRPRVTAPRAALAFAVIFSVWAQSAWLRVLLEPIDEGYIASFAWRMAHGRMLAYVDAVSHRGPLTYDLVALFTLVFGDAHAPSALPIRLAGVVTNVATVLLLGACGALGKERLAGALAAVADALVLVAVMWPDAAYNAEHPLNVAALGAFALTIAALARERPGIRMLAAAGAVASLAPLAKQVGGLVVPTLGLWVLAAAVSRPAIERRHRVGMIAAYALGALTAPLFYLARYAAAGQLRALRYWMFTYNTDVYMAPYTWPVTRAHLARFATENAGKLLAGTAAVVIAFVLAMRATRGKSFFARWDEQGFLLTVALSAVCSFVGAKVGLRDYGTHYYVQIVPWFALLGALLLVRWLDHLTRRGQTRATPMVLGAVALVAAVVTLGHARTLATLARRAPPAMHPSTLPLCRLVAAHSGEDDAMFVWGFQPWHYVECRRRPATRYVFTTFQMGFVPWFMHESPAVEAARVVPGSRETMLADLESSKPPVIVDGPIGWRHMDAYPIFASYLREHYCAIGSMVEPSGPIDGIRVSVYLRLSDGACPVEARPRDAALAP